MRKWLILSQDDDGKWFHSIEIMVSTQAYQKSWIDRLWSYMDLVTHKSLRQVVTIKSQTLPKKTNKEFL